MFAPCNVSVKVSRDQRDNDDPDHDDPDELIRDQSFSSNGKANKLKKHDVELPAAEVDIKLAEKLDNLLKIGDKRAPRFFINKPKVSELDHDGTENGHFDSKPRPHINMGSIKPRNLTPQQLRDRLLKRYDTLVPELDPNRTSVKVVKVLSAKESLEMGREEAKKQLFDQMKLNSISGNQRAHSHGLGAFKFNDGYEMPCKNFYSKSFDVFRGQTQSSKFGRPESESESISSLAQPEKDKADLEERIKSETTKSLRGVTKNVRFVEPSDRNPIDTAEVSNPYDFFAPDDDDEEEDDDVDNDNDNVTDNTLTHGHHD